MRESVVEFLEKLSKLYLLVLGGLGVIGVILVGGYFAYVKVLVLDPYVMQFVLFALVGFLFLGCVVYVVSSPTDRQKRKFRQKEREVS